MVCCLPSLSFTIIFIAIEKVQETKHLFSCIIQLVIVYSYSLASLLTIYAKTHHL